MSREKKGSKTTSRNISRAERRKRNTKSKFKGDPIDEGGGKRGSIMQRVAKSRMQKYAAMSKHDLLQPL